MIRRLSLNIIVFITFTVTLEGQELVTGLQSNPIIVNSMVPVNLAKANDTLELPFFDDFSGQGIFPDLRLWSDNFVFINNTYSDRQITSGVATLDALDNSGHLYEEISSGGFAADQLTSQPINLELPATENIWLSFYYQPGGLGDMPEENDSLTLQFYSPIEEKWYSVWRNPGIGGQLFKPVILSIDDQKFLKKGFRFRFMNFGSISPNLTDPSMIGNCDLWNIDYVMLDRGRNSSDTIFTDVAFRKPIRSLLKTHEAMPWKQFNQIYLQEMGSSIPIHYRNNDIITRNVTRNFEIWDIHKNALAKFFSAGATNIDPLTNVDYDASLIYTFNTDNTDSALFRVKSWLITDEFDPKGNDTLVYYQRFGNYFAFDDGSAEAGYGINGLGSRNAMVACRFKSYMQDTLRGISIMFNDSYLNSNQRSIDLMVWNEINGLPGDLIYSREEVMVLPGNSLNGFHTYKLPGGIMVNNTFYVGWRQRSETFINAGIDFNTSGSAKQFYWINGNWNASQVSGTLMVRPLVGDDLFTGIKDILYKKLSTLHIWPNPSREYITIDAGEIPMDGRTEIAIIDLSGKIRINEQLSEKINISSLPEGIYIIVAYRDGNPAGYGRVVKTN